MIHSCGLVAPQHLVDRRHSYSFCGLFLGWVRCDLPVYGCQDCADLLTTDSRLARISSHHSSSQTSAVVLLTTGASSTRLVCNLIVCQTRALETAYALLTDPGLGCAIGTCCWDGAPIGSEAARLRFRWAGYRRFPNPRISARSSSDRPPQIPYGSRVRSACWRHSSRTGHPLHIALARSILLCFCRRRSLAGW